MRDRHLNELEKMPNVAPAMYLNAASYFKKLKQRQIAYRLLAIAHKNYPGNQLVLTDLVNIELERGGSTQIGKHIKQLLKIKQPPKETLDKAYKLLTSDRFIFTRDRDQIIIELETQLGINRLSNASGG